MIKWYLLLWLLVPANNIGEFAEVGPFKSIDDCTIHAQAIEEKWTSLPNGGPEVLWYCMGLDNNELPWLEE